MELTAALEGLRSLRTARTHGGHRLTVDAQLDDGLAARLEEEGLEDRRGKPVKNQDLLVALEAEVNRLGSVRWHWVRGHETGAEHAHKAFNDRADQLAVAAAKAAA